MPRPRLFGPLLRYELLTSARRARYYALRGMYVALLGLILWIAYSYPAGGGVGAGSAMQAIKANAATTSAFFTAYGFAALGAGNGSLFQLVPLRWPVATAVAGSMIGEIGALGGGFIPTAMGFSKTHTGTYAWGFVAFAGVAAIMLVVLRTAQVRWTKTWAEKGGRARYAPVGL